MKERIIRALYDDDTITVYQAYKPAIARAAVAKQTFTSPFKKDRMTWIKPSFLWMMYRSGWATKENQERIVAVKMKRSAFEWALENACLSHFDETVHKSQEDWRAELKATPVRLQWDPEKDLFLQNLNYRSIQIGLSGIAVTKYIDHWITAIDDITEESTNIRRLLEASQIEEARALLPVERVYPLPLHIAAAIKADY